MDTHLVLCSARQHDRSGLPPVAVPLRRRLAVLRREVREGLPRRCRRLIWRCIRRLCRGLRNWRQSFVLLGMALPLPLQEHRHMSQLQRNQNAPYVLLQSVRHLESGLNETTMSSRG